jgi:hypothetical protein
MFFLLVFNCGYAVVQLIEALRYKPEVAGPISDGVIGNFHPLNPSSRTIALGLIQTLTEMNSVSPGGA